LYKAAYYSPVKGGVGSPGYYAYATQSDSPPGNTIGPGTNQANYYAGDYAVTQSASYSSSQNYLTDVGAFTNSGSYYGTFDQSGNVHQWNDPDELAPSGLSRGFQGGSWRISLDPANMSSSYFSGGGFPSLESSLIGFRLASPASSPSTVPEIDPNSIGSALGLVLGGLGLLERRRLKAA